MTTDYRDRFGLSHHPFEKRFLHNHHFETDGTRRLAQRLEWLLSERGLGLLTGPSGVGKTAALHAVLRPLPSHRYRVVYLEDSAASAGDLFRSLAFDLDLQPAYRRANMWRDLKAHLRKLDDENDQQVVLVIDDAHRLSPAFLLSLGGFMNFAFDSHEVLTTWLVGDSRLRGTLALNTHRHLHSRVRLHVHLDPLARPQLHEYVTACLAAAGSTRQILTDPAVDATFHLSHGLPRIAANLMSVALRLAHEQDADIVCDRIMEEAARELML